MSRCTNAHTYRNFIVNREKAILGTTKKNHAWASESVGVVEKPKLTAPIPASTIPKPTIAPAKPQDKKEALIICLSDDDDDFLDILNAEDDLPLLSTE